MEAFIQEKKVVEPKGKFKHVMALTLNSKTNFQDGIIRCVMNREGELDIKGYVDNSELHLVRANEDGTFEIGDQLEIKDDSQIIRNLIGEGDFIGFEDPDIWVDEDTGLMHLYFTIPVRTLATSNEKAHTFVSLGHAVGLELSSLVMTEPVLVAGGSHSAKEVSIAHKNIKGFRYNLFESRDRRAEKSYSTVGIALARDMGKPWEYGPIAFHPAEHNIPWIAEHASPGPLFPKSFIDIGEGKLVGIMNGREMSEEVDGQIIYKIFSVGLFIYDYEEGKIEWVSPERFLMDSEAKIITFASQFVETGPGVGTLYAHGDDSFVRAFTLNSDGIRKLLPEDFR
jgi:hypothetical protein